MTEAGVSTGGRVVGRYILYDELAAGGMATVHIGRLLGESGFARSVAIKRLHPQFARDPEFASGFLEEARLAARIRHPNVVPVLDVASTDGELFLVMEYVSGETLVRLTRVSRSRHRIVPMNIALAIASDFLMGLHAAHEARDENGAPLHIVHRDVSPHNVMVGRDGVARVLDFGIAKASSSSQSTREGEVKGKFAYMSPEQLSSQPVDRRADVFCGAIVLWEILTGQRLFAAADPAGVVGKVLTAVIDPPSKVAPGLPPAIDAVVMRGLERDVTKRFQTAKEMAQAIEATRVAIARPNEVGAWVDRIAGDSLKRRAKRIAQIEATGSAPIPLPDLSGPLVVENTGSQSRSGLRPAGHSFTADASSSMSNPVMPLVDVTEPPARRSRKGIVFVALLAALGGGAGVFVWRSGGVANAKAKLVRLIPHRETTHVSMTLTAKEQPSGSAQASVASRSVATPVASAVSLNPTLRFHAHTGWGSRGGRTGASHDEEGNVDPRLATNVAPGNAGGSGGDMNEALKNAGGGGIGVGKDAIQQQADTQNIGARPSLGQVQVAIAHVMPNVRACLLPDDPESRATLTFQSDGSVKSVSVSGFAAGKPQEACIRSAFLRARTGQFSDPTFVIPVPVRP